MKTKHIADSSLSCLKNADGSADIYFGPTAPASGESNWIPADPNGRFEVIARFYGPKKPLFDKSWKLPDIERVTYELK
jgi:hypothetical protein